jgi:hypothetical protein
MFVYTPARYEQVRELLATGLNPYEVARRTGIPRSTVQQWQGHDWAHRRARLNGTDWTAEQAPHAYCYLLGLYLGDGHVQVIGRSAILRVTLDSRYPALIDEAVAALEAVFRPRTIGRYVRGDGSCVVLQISGMGVPIAFPQHGRGPKHTRPIVLAPWQRELTRAHPGALVRGLIHSDGCRTVNRFKTKLPSGRVATYEYPRYFFSNLSEDIRGIFCEHCELLGVRWTQSNPRNISVSHRDSVAILEEVVGPKT